MLLSGMAIADSREKEEKEEMKHWNRNKKYRELSWTIIDVPQDTLTWKPTPPYTQSIIGLPIRDAKIWCQQNGSDSRFFVQPYAGKFWFENSEDALAFKLKWIVGNQNRDLVS